MGRIRTEGVVCGWGAKIACAFALALAMGLMVAVQEAFAAEVEYVGTVITQPLIDDDGYPVFNEDGTIKRGNPQIQLSEIRNAPETFVIPDTMDVIDENDASVVHKDIPVTVLDIRKSWNVESGFPGVKTIDARGASSLTALNCNGMSSLETITCEGGSLRSIVLDGNPQLASVNLNECSDLMQISLTGCAKLSLESLAPYFSNLEMLSLYSREDLESFDGSSMPNLTELVIGGTNLASIDVSSNKKLEKLSLLSNQLRSLDVDTIPENVTMLECRENYLEDTDALVDRFGEDAVLPQREFQITGLSVVSEYDASGTLAVGQTRQVSLDQAYRPTAQEAGNFYKEAPAKAYSADNFTMHTSSPEVLAIEESRDSSQSFTFSGTASGTTTLTIEYHFQGDFATYEGRQEIEFTVASSENPVVSYSCDSAITMPLLTCAITGSPHSVRSDERVSLPIEITPSDPSRLATDTLSFEVENSSEGVVDATVGMRTDKIDGRYTLHLFPQASGSSTVTLKGTVRDDDGLFVRSLEPVTITVEVVDKTPRPTLNVLTSATKWYYPEGASVGTEAIIAPSAGGIASYEESDDLSIETAAHMGGGGFVWGNSKVEETDTPVFTAESDNSDVVSIQQDDMVYVRLQYKSVGTANITIEDVWGNKDTCAVTVKDLPTEVKKYRLSKQEITINKGDTLDLSELIQTEQPVARMARTLFASDSSQDELIGKPVFKSSNGSILPIKYNDEGAVSQVLGRDVGDVKVSANILKPGAPEGAPLYTVDQWEVFEFSTLTVHVVEPQTPDNPATSVSVSAPSDRVELGSTLQLSATVTPADATNADTLAWSSSDQAVATVDAQGAVSPVACGTATITVTVGSVSDFCKITVVPRTVPAAGITLAPVKTLMNIGDEQLVSATVAPTDATDKVEWTSSDNAVLVVDQAGNVKAVGNGTASIKAAAGSVSAETDPITVVTPVSGVTLDASTLELYAGAEPSTLRATVMPSTASNTQLTWTSSNQAVATVDAQGMVRPVAPGSAVVTVRTANGSFTATCTVTVKQHAEGISLDKRTLSLSGASTSDLKATVAPDNATNKDVVWSVSDEKVATVDAQGKVTAVGKGEATVTVSTADGGLSDTCTVTVSNPVTGIELDPATLSLIKGDVANISAIYAAELPGEMDDAGPLTWRTADQSVLALVPDGLVCAIKALSSGSAVVEASLKDGAVSAFCTVSVANPLQSIALSETSKTVTVGDASFSLDVIVTPIDADQAAVSWSTSDAAVATVTPTGTVEIVGAGAANIVATVGEKSATCALTVKTKEIASTSTNTGFSASVEVSSAETARKLAEKAGEGLNLVVRDSDLTDAAKQTLESLQSAGLTIAETLDIHFAKDNGEVLMVNDDGSDLALTVKIKMTDAMKALDPATLLVRFVSDDGSVEERKTWVEGDLLCFTTNHFSTYVVTGLPPATPGGGGGQSDASSATPLPAPPSKEGLAPTGDVVGNTLSLIALTGVIAGMVLLFARKRAR